MARIFRIRFNSKMGNFFSGEIRPRTTLESVQQWMEVKSTLRAFTVVEMRLERRRAPQSSDRGVVVFVIGFTLVLAVSRLTATRPIESSVRT